MVAKTSSCNAEKRGRNGCDKVVTLARQREQESQRITPGWLFGRSGGSVPWCAGPGPDRRRDGGKVRTSMDVIRTRNRIQSGAEPTDASCQGRQGDRMMGHAKASFERFINRNL